MSLPDIVTLLALVAATNRFEEEPAVIDVGLAVIATVVFTDVTTVKLIVV